MKTITDKKDILAELKKYEDWLFEFEYLKDGFIVYHLNNSLDYLNVVLKVKQDQAYENTLTGEEIIRIIDNDSRLNFVECYFLSQIRQRFVTKIHLFVKNI